MEWLTGLGYFGLFLGSFLAATIIPFSSDFLIIGSLIAGLDMFQIFWYATVGSFLGSMSSYCIGYMCKWNWLEKYFKVKRETLDKQKRFIDKWGAPSALISWIPFVGDIIPIALGFYRVRFVPVTVYMFVGKALRAGFWVGVYAVYGEKFVNWIGGIIGLGA